GLQVIVPSYFRIFGGVIFSNDALETLPDRRHATPQLLDEARKLVEQYRNTAMPVVRPTEAISEELLNNFRKPLLQRSASFVRRSAAHPDLFEVDMLRTGFLNNLAWLRDRWWRLRIARAEREFDVDRPQNLPPRFIYYPLQTTPESSINTPAPYFVDQLRVIDAIRFAMPNDHLLVIKEHPVGGIPIRPISFMRSVRRRAGVVVAHYRTDARALTERAACTVSVTGTATLEAFLLGKPSLSLGSNFITEYLGGPCPIDKLNERLHDVIAHPPSDELIVQAIAQLLSVRYDWHFNAPGAPGGPVLRPRSVDRLLEAILDHIRKSGSVD